MKKAILFFTVIVFLGYINVVSAADYEIQSLSNTPNKEDFVLGPGRTELVLSPGEKSVQEITVTNRLGREMDFKVSVEDFSGSYNTDQPVILLGEEEGQYSLKEYIKPAVSEFHLKHGERIIIPVEISIPQDSEPGGLYGSVLVATDPSEQQLEENKGGATLISRLGNLFFVRVKGDANESGFLKEFTLDNFKEPFYENGPISFSVLFQNEGNVHLAPSGRIEIKNILGKKVGEIDVDKFFVMPSSVRERKFEWNYKFLLGKYTATLILDKGYQQTEIPDEELNVSFWVFPWKTIIPVFVGLILVLMLLKYIVSKFKIEIKKKGD